MKGLASIVVGLDFSECSRVALGHAQRVASWAGAQVHPVHVVDAPADEMPEEAALTAMQRGIREGLVEDARRRWDAFIEGTPGASDLRLDACVAHRLVGIRQYLDHHKADLLVLGAFGEERPNVGMGTLASSCIRGVPTDVLIVRDTYRKPFRTVVVGIDFSATCQRALEAAALVANGDCARLYAVYVESTKAEAYAWVHGDAPLNLQSFVKPTADRYPELEVHAKVFPYLGHRSGVLEFAALVNADLIAVGTRGRSNLRDVVLGSTAEKVVRDSVCAVWAAKPRL
jgi:universal stress protein E